MITKADFFAAYADGAPDCIEALDLERRITHINPAGRALFEGNADALVSKLWPDQWPESEADAVSQALATAEAGEAAHFIAMRPTAVGVECHWDVRVSPVRDESGSIKNFLVVSRDCTAEMATERELRQSRARLELGAKVAGLALAEVDYSSGLNRLSAEAARLYGLGNEAMAVPRACVHDAFHVLDREGIFRNIDRALDPFGLGWFEMDHRVVHPSGEVRWLRVRKQVYFITENGVARPSRAMLAAFDVTKEKATEAAVQQSEEFLRDILDSLPQQVVVLDADGRILAVNKTWERFAEANGGTNSKLWVGDNYLGVVRHGMKKGDKYAEAAFDGLNRILLGEAEECLLEYPCKTTDIEHWFSMHAARVQGSRAAIVLSHSCITDRKRNEEKRREAEAQLRTSDRNKDTFIATLAHELRNPLATLRSGLAILKRGSGTTETVRVHDIIGRQIEHLVRLVDDLIDVSRISRGKVVLRQEHTDLAALLRQVLATARDIGGSRGLTVSGCGLDGSFPVNGDPVRLIQIFSNLMDNAFKFTEPGGRVVLMVERIGDQADVHVIDTGIGIPRELLASIFDLFTQGERTPKDDGRAGLGIGLALVKSLTELHGGTVWAESEGEGKGTRFVVRLPVVPLVPNEGDSKTAKPFRTGEGVRILLIDDNRDAADTLGMLLTSLGATVRVEYSGMEGLSAASEFQPGIILLDLGMPGMDGYQTARLLRERHQDAVKLAALTGWSESETRRRVVEAGFDMHIIKPVSMEELEKLLN